MRRRNEITEQEFTEDAEDIRENLEALNKAYETLEKSNALAANKKDKMLLLKDTLQKEFSDIECTDEIIKGLVKNIVVHSRDNIEIHLSGDIEANFAINHKDITDCTIQSVLLSTYEYDFSNIFVTVKNTKQDVYRDVKITVYIDI